MPYHYQLRPNKSPTYTNLAQYLKQQNWKPTRFKWRAQFSEKNFQFPTVIAEQLEFKHLLAQLVKQSCPEVMPLTYSINDHNWSMILSQIAMLHPNTRWILKPALLNNGQHIKIFQNINQIEQHFLSNKRMGGEHVLQQYLSHPYLLKGPKLGHKFSIRMFVVLTNYAGAYLFPEGYFNIALHPYAENEFSDLRSHITNEHLSDEELNVVQIPTAQYEFFKDFYPQIKLIVTKVLNQIPQDRGTCSRDPKLAIFGFDFLIDEDSRVWLLEANHAPCFPINDDHPLQKSVYLHFWQAFISSFVAPIAKKKACECTKTQFFEQIKNID